MRESKECVECGGIYFRPEYVHASSEWEARKYCSVKCANEAHRRERSEIKEAMQALEPHLEARHLEPEVIVREPKAPIERELRIVRVGPNPRMVVCEYMELAERRVCTVMVKRNEKFVRGMRFKMAEPVEEALFVRPWVYDGAAPRRRGKW